MSAISEPGGEMILSMQAEQERQALLHEELILTQQMDTISSELRVVRVRHTQVSALKDLPRLDSTNPADL